MPDNALLRISVSRGERVPSGRTKSIPAGRPEALAAELRPIAKAVGAGHVPVVVACNKCDLIKEKARILPLLAAVGEALPGAELYPVSALTGILRIFPGLSTWLPSLVR